MKKILFLDTYYGAVLSALPAVAQYETRVEQLKHTIFGTADFYSETFRKLGWDAHDLVANDPVGMELWCREHDLPYFGLQSSAIHYINWFQPDVLYLQDLGFLPLHTLSFDSLIAGQHSCPWAGDERVKELDVLFTSFPHYIERIRACGPRSEFLQIGFGGMGVYGRMPPMGSYYERALGVTFVGGVGNDGDGGHWTRGTQMLTEVAKQVDDFLWWGYGRDNLADSVLKRVWQGPAWGRDMYRILMNSKIVVNRHGEVARGYSNNMRMFEATGCGALLMTEHSPNIGHYFEPGKECVTYESTEDLIEKIRYYRHNEQEADIIAQAGKNRTLKDHRYERILKTAHDVLEYETQ